jgi:hypothetical protein
MSLSSLPTPPDAAKHRDTQILKISSQFSDQRFFLKNQKKEENATATEQNKTLIEIIHSSSGEHTRRRNHTGVGEAIKVRFDRRRRRGRVRSGRTARRSHIRRRGWCLSQNELEQSQHTQRDQHCPMNARIWGRMQDGPAEKQKANVSESRGSGSNGQIRISYMLFGFDQSFSSNLSMAFFAHSVTSANTL